MAYEARSDFKRDDKCIDTVFKERIGNDIENFIQGRCNKSVLVFPAVTSYCRLVIHKLVQETFEDYFTFSIGQEPNRRIIVCPKNILLSENDSHTGGIEADATAKPIDLGRTMVMGPDEPIIPTPSKKSKTVLPTVQLYRPPAARRSQNEVVLPVPPLEPPLKETKPKTRVRRPDIQVYVPRAKRLSAVENSKQDAQGQPSYISPDENPSKTSSDRLRTSKDCSQSPVSVRPRASAIVQVKKQLCQSTSLSDLEYEVDSNCSMNLSDQDMMADVMNNAKLSSTMNGSNLLPRAEALVEMKKRLCQNLVQDNLESCPKLDVPSVHVENSSESPSQGDDNIQVISKGNNNCASDTLLLSENIHCAVIDNSRVTIEEEKCDSDVLRDVLEDLPSNNEVSFSEVDVSDEVLPKESVVNVRSTMEHPLYSSGYMSDSPPSSESGSNHSLSSIESCDISNKTSSIDQEDSNKAKRNQVFNPDECDWDDLLDENGECLDPFLMKELTHVVGEVTVARPQSDYSEYRSRAPSDRRSLRRTDDDFGHVLEIYSFPPEFKTQDLMAVFLPFKNTGGGFEIKWVDDTHALGVFASSLVAAEVLEYRHPIVRTRPLSEGIQESRLKARRLSESIQSFRPRPATCAALARRLVTGALGVKLETARQEREEEKKVLQEARERRRLAAKQREEIWNN